MVISMANTSLHQGNMSRLVATLLKYLLKNSNQTEQ